MVKIGCISLHVSGISLTLWLHMSYGCGGEVFFGYYSCPMNGLCGGFLV